MTRLEDISGEITSPKSCAGGGLPEHWTAVEARKKHEMTIRKDEREKVLDELSKWVREYDTMYYGDDMPIDILRDKFEELRRQSKDGE
jgi:hypothetical protein